MLDALILSGDSQIGKALIAKLRQDGRRVVATTRKWPPDFATFFKQARYMTAHELSVVDLYTTEDIIPFDLRWPTFLPQARVTFFCTGINGFAPCQADPKEARRINVTLLTAAARQVARMALVGDRLVFLSSAAAESHPDTVYGQCKLEAEKVFLELGAACYRFGPVAFPGRNVYPNGEYNPISLSTWTELLAGCFEHWEPGLHRITNRDWKPEATA